MSPCQSLWLPSCLCFLCLNWGGTPGRQWGGKSLGAGSQWPVLSAMWLTWTENTDHPHDSVFFGGGDRALWALVIHVGCGSCAGLVPGNNLWAAILTSTV